MSPDEQRVVRAAGGFLGLVAHRGPTASAPGWPYIGGRSPIHLFDRRGSIDYSGKGVWFHYSTPSDPRQLVLLVKWQQIRDHARTLPTDLLERLRDHRSRRLAHQNNHPGYPGRWHGIPYAVPRNSLGQTWEEVDEWWHTVHMPEYRALDAERAALLDEVFPLAVAHEPVDLLELLAVTP